MANNVMKAMYPINLSNDGRNDQERNMVNVNQERLNDNFRSISSALSDLFQSGEHTLNYLSARIKSSEDGYVTTLNGITEKVDTQSAEILAMPNAIMQAVGYSITNYNPNGDPVQQSVNSLITQQSGSVEVQFTQVNSQLGTIQEWVRIVSSVPASTGVHATEAGVIIGKNTVDVKLKAEPTALFFYKGADSNGWWPAENEAANPNALAGFDANGNLVAGGIHNDSVLLNGKFDIDVVTANGVDFLHITGRS